VGLKKPIKQNLPVFRLQLFGKRICLAGSDTRKARVWGVAHLSSIEDVNLR
jgi:hypothetical protein